MAAQALALAVDARDNSLEMLILSESTKLCRMIVDQQDRVTHSCQVRRPGDPAKLLAGNAAGGERCGGVVSGGAVTRSGGHRVDDYCAWRPGGIRQGQVIDAGALDASRGTVPPLPCAPSGIG